MSACASLPYSLNSVGLQWSNQQSCLKHFAVKPHHTANLPERGKLTTLNKRQVEKIPFLDEIN